VLRSHAALRNFGALLWADGRACLLGIQVAASPAGARVPQMISDNGAACEATEPNHAAVESLDRDLHEG
jgi:hypothetical protein